MMEFKKYQHVERYGTINVNGITDGKCYIFPKIDGTNSSIWLNSGICCGSRKRQLNLEKDNKGFFMDFQNNQKYLKFLQDNPNVRLFGEFLVPHTLRTYSADAWRKFYVFDVVIESDEFECGYRYMSYDEYSVLLDKYDITYIKPIAIIQQPTYDQLVECLMNNNYLVTEGIGEGIVIKNYSFVNKFGRVTWAKILSKEFVDKKRDKHKSHTDRITGSVEEKIVNTYITSDLCEKTYNKILNEVGYFESKMIPRVLNTIYYDFLTEETYNFVRKFKLPTIDFKTLQSMVFERIKSNLPQIFGE